MGIANECVRRWMKQCNATLHRERPVGGGGRAGGGGRDQISHGQISISRHDLLAEWASPCLPWGLPAIPGRASPVLRGLSQLAQVRLAISVVFPPPSARPTPDPRLDLARSMCVHRLSLSAQLDKVQNTEGALPVDACGRTRPAVEDVGRSMVLSRPVL